MESNYQKDRIKNKIEASQSKETPRFSDSERIKEFRINMEKRREELKQIADEIEVKGYTDEQLRHYLKREESQDRKDSAPLDLSEQIRKEYL